MTTVLLVDDDPNVLAALGRLPRAHGYRVDTAANGAEALRKAHTDTPDLVLFDYIMP
jgi:CheY-like chemotaxis protein